MDTFLKYLGGWLAHFSSILGIMKSVRIRLYTGYYAKKFKKFGKGSLLLPYSMELGGLSTIEIGCQCIIGEGIILTSYKKYGHQNFTPSIIIGDKVSLGCRNHITCISHIVIGKGVLTGPDVLITDNSHGEIIKEELTVPPKDRLLSSKGNVVIEDNVWIGEKASIMPGVHIGKGSIVACNSVVTKDVPENCLVAGIPAKIIKYL